MKQASRAIKIPISKERAAGGPVESREEALKQWFTAHRDAETNTLFLNHLQGHQ
jgi:hypothetical protein